MKGNPDIIAMLNDVLTAELTAINRYFVHSRMCANWGYEALAERRKKDSIRNMHAAAAVIDRILLLDGVPNLQRLNPVGVGEYVPEQHELDLADEVGAIAHLNKGIGLCREKADNGSRHLLEGILREHEETADWLEAQLHLIKEIGRERYLSEQMS